MVAALDRCLNLRTNAETFGQEVKYGEAFLLPHDDSPALKVQVDQGLPSQRRGMIDLAVYRTTHASLRCHLVVLEDPNGNDDTVLYPRKLGSTQDP